MGTSSTMRGWSEADAGAYGDGRVAPPDLAQLERDQRSTYDPVPVPRLWPDGPRRLHRADPVMNGHGHALCRICGQGLSIYSPSSYTTRAGRLVQREPYWSHR